MIGFSSGAGSAARKTLELEVKIKGENSGAARAMAELTAHAEKLTAGLGKARAEAERVNAAVARPLAHANVVSGPGTYGLMAAPPQGAMSLPGSRMSVMAPAGASPGGVAGPHGAAAAGQSQGLLRGGWTEAAAAVAIISEVTRQVGEFGLVMANVGQQIKTARVAADEQAKSIPVVGGAFSSLFRMVLGFRDRILEGDTVRAANREQLYAPAIELGIQFRGEAGRAIGGARREYHAAGYAAEAAYGYVGEVAAEMAGYPAAVAGLSPTDRGYYQQRQGARLGVQRAELGTASAEAAYAEAERKRRRDEENYRTQAGRAVAAGELVERERQRQVHAPVKNLGIPSELGKDLAYKVIDGRTSSVERMAAPENLTRAQVRLETELKELAEREANLKQSTTESSRRLLELEQKRAEAARARTEVLKTELAITSQQEGQARSAATSYGAMDAGQRSELLWAAGMLKNGGIESLSPEHRQLVLGNEITGDYARQSAIDAAGKDPAYQQFLKDFNKEDAKTLEQRRIKLEQEVSVNVAFDEAKLAESLEAALRKAFERIEEFFKVKAGEIEARQALKLAQGTTAQQ